ncbi:MAG: hypothetical protein ACRDMV_00950 [Streptosporangiales bacterium]
MQPATGPLRALRALLVAAACLAVSLFGHAAAGGMVPSDRLLGIAWALLAIVAYLLSGRRWTFGRLLLVLGGTQTVLHPVFEYGDAHAGMATESVDAALAMSLTHLLAAGVLAVALARGDAALWRLFTAVASLLTPLASVLPRTALCSARYAATPARCPQPRASTDVRCPLAAAVDPRTTRGPPKHARPSH